MKSIADLVGIREYKQVKGDYGVEIEVEGEHLPHGIEGWKEDADPSLKAAESVEYVMPVPKDLDGVAAALGTFIKAAKDNNTIIHESVRAGVHVHMNVQQWNLTQVMTFATIWFILEDLLVKWCGENREGNLFCLRSADAEQVLFAMSRALEKRNLNELNTEDIRYCSLNFLSLFKYGSLEFRSMRSTADINAIFTWVQIIDELKKSVELFQHPIDVVMSMSGDGEDMFLHRVLPTYWELFTYPGFEKTIRDACRRVQMVAFTVDWDSLGRPSKNPFIPVGF